MHDTRGQKTLNGIQMSTLWEDPVIIFEDNLTLSETPVTVLLCQQIFHCGAMANHVCDQSLYMKQMTNASSGQRLNGARW